MPKQGEYERELDKPDHIPGQYVDDIPDDADTSPEPENDTVEETP